MHNSIDTVIVCLCIIKLSYNNTAICPAWCGRFGSWTKTLWGCPVLSGPGTLSAEYLDPASCSFRSLWMKCGVLLWELAGAQSSFCYRWNRACSATLLKYMWYVSKSHPHECQYLMFPCRVLLCNRIVGVISLYLYWIILCTVAVFLHFEGSMLRWRERGIRACSHGWDGVWVTIELAAGPPPLLSALSFSSPAFSPVSQFSLFPLPFCLLFFPTLSPFPVERERSTCWLSNCKHHSLLSHPFSFTLSPLSLPAGD